MGENWFTDVMLHSSTSYHQEHAYPTATEAIRTHTPFVALLFHRTAEFPLYRRF